ncbi:DUF1801 domain-containing protein [uncultured Methanolobus sp.]|uniref:DUF1801 domain-containing protein n=1 Tax=uncultured Methanolobus sp. TaxID=218300 RepID=UPI002AAAE8BC|nr:DUF1801 domain-containing protein [uncultured Methanolobus sp.]
MEKNQRIDDFVNEALLVNGDLGEIIVSLRKLVMGIYPQAEEEIKYGGLVFIIDERLFCGIFLRKNHVSVEFDNGAEMSDNEKKLEGTGKHRRHLKIRNYDDIIDKKVDFFLKQSFAVL